MRYASLTIAAAVAIATPALADDVGIHAAPPGAGVTIGSAHVHHDRDRDDRTTVVRQDAPGDRATVITKEIADGVESRTVIHYDRDWSGRHGPPIVE